METQKSEIILFQVTQLGSEKSKTWGQVFLSPSEIFLPQMNLSDCEDGGTWESWLYEWNEKELRRKLETGRRILKGGVGTVKDEPGATVGAPYSWESQF